MRAYLWIEVGLAAFAACAHPGTAPAPAACERYDLDPSWAAGSAVYQSCDVDVRAQVVYRVSPQHHQSDCENGGSSATVRFVVDTAGRPEPLTLTAVDYTSSTFADALIDAVRQTRWRPALKAGVPVRQVAQVRAETVCRRMR